MSLTDSLFSICILVMLLTTAGLSATCSTWVALRPTPRVLTVARYARPALAGSNLWAVMMVGTMFATL